MELPLERLPEILRNSRRRRSPTVTVGEISSNIRILLSVWEVFSHEVEWYREDRQSFVSAYSVH